MGLYILVFFYIEYTLIDKGGVKVILCNSRFSCFRHLLLFYSSIFRSMYY